ncbi:MAG: hypothetical protein J6K42_06815 [Clostridia bacterium]|nr:hypothetical protein [Clostridia bacterium]
MKKEVKLKYKVNMIAIIIFCYSIISLGKVCATPAQEIVYIEPSVVTKIITCASVPLCISIIIIAIYMIKHKRTKIFGIIAIIFSIGITYLNVMLTNGILLEGESEMKLFEFQTILRFISLIIIEIILVISNRKQLQ